jgi:hypothetical protein
MGVPVLFVKAPATARPAANISRPVTLPTRDTSFVQCAVSPVATDFRA